MWKAIALIPMFALFFLEVCRRLRRALPQSGAVCGRCFVQAALNARAGFQVVLVALVGLCDDCACEIVRQQSRCQAMQAAGELQAEMFGTC